MNTIDEDTHISNKETLNRGLFFSVLLHALFIAFFSLKTVLFKSEAIDFSKAIRVDLVALPEKVSAPPLPEPETTQQAQVQQEKKSQSIISEAKTATIEKKTTAQLQKPQKAQDAIGLVQVKSKQKSAIEKLRAMAAMEKFKEELAKKATSSQKIKGNVLSPGTALTGLAKLQHDSYASTLDDHIKQNWSLPEWLSKREFRARARVFIDSYGNILDREIVKSSGNSSYDDAVLQTIDRSAPFPAPPEKFVALVSVEGILIGFPE